MLTRYKANSDGMDCYRKTNDAERWCTMTNGDLEYLVISGGPQGSFVWTDDLSLAAASTTEYEWAEGLAVRTESFISRQSFEAPCDS